MKKSTKYKNIFFVKSGWTGKNVGTTHAVTKSAFGGFTLQSRIVRVSCDDLKSAIL